MELRIRDGDYVPDGAGGLIRVSGREALVQRVLYRLTARRGSFPFWTELGSQLWQLGALPPQQRQSAAAQYVAEALDGEADLEVETVTLTEGTDGTGELTAQLKWRGEALSVSLRIQ